MGIRFVTLSLAFAGVLAAAPPAASPAGYTEALKRGNERYFNLEFEEALGEFYAALRERETASVWNHIAATILFQELHRLGRLETSAFRGDNAFLSEPKPNPDPEANERFLAALYHSRRLAEAEVEKDPRDVAALFSLSSNYGLQANYEFMMQKAHFSALRNGGRARRYAEQVLAVDPDFIDAYLVRGVQEYIVGSLPWAVKALAALGGVRGNKQRGEEWVTRVALEGKELDDEARVLLVFLHRRENRPLEAARILRELIVRFPRNFVYRLELGAMLLDAEEPAQALEVFSETRRMVREDIHRLGRMPERLRTALERKIEELQSDASVRAE